jgi:Icc-related predicted phosphoesterase
MKLVVISDTHTQHPKLKLPEGDILIHCGDFTIQGTKYETTQFVQWFGQQPHPNKILVSGNHDFFCEEEPEFIEALCAVHGINYLQNSSTRIRGIKFYGSPHTPWFYDWAWNFPRNDDGTTASKCWANIPDDTDVLITHGPAHLIGDRVKKPRPGEDPNVGCPELRKRIESLNLRLHCWGHIHEQYGTYQYSNKQTIGVCASVLDSKYRLANNPVVLFLDSDESLALVSSQRSENDVASAPTSF